MRALVLDIDPALLEERRRLGIDRWDEMWEGLLHMVPPRSRGHQQLGPSCSPSSCPSPAGVD